jgi:hypothetical protein
MTNIKILHRYLKEGETITVDAKATLPIELCKLQKMFKFNYKTFDQDSRNHYSCYDVPSSLHNDFSGLQMLHEIDFENPIQLTESIVKTTNIKTECGCNDDDLSLMDDYINYLKIHGPCDDVEKTMKLINKRVTRKFYSTLINDNENALNILSKMYHNSPCLFEGLPLNNDKPYKFPFQKDDELMFVLTLQSKNSEIKPRNYLITLKIM